MGSTTVMGLGRSGVSAIRALSKMGKDIFVTELRGEGEIQKETIEWCKTKKIQCEFGRHSTRALENCSEIIISPGVRWDHPFLQMARERKVPVISELEFAIRHLTVPIIAITGTNGKTTTTSLIASILTEAGYVAPPAGNIGYPASELLFQKIDFAVLEVSSFHLEGTLTLRPRVAVLLNITPDHIDRHPTMEAYQIIKKRIFENQREEDVAVWNAGDPNVLPCTDNIVSRSLPFNAPPMTEYGASVTNGKLQARAVHGDVFEFPLASSKLRGKHNADNMMAATLASLALAVPHSAITRALETFPGVPHRLETVGNLEEREFINDSKATNPESSIVGIHAISENCAGRIVLLAGGRDKKTPLTVWTRAVVETCREVVLIGEAKERFASELRSTGYTRIHFAKDMPEAVDTAFRISKSGDAILFSPACASFDMFRDYEDRGNQFRDTVHTLTRNLTHAS